MSVRIFISFVAVFLLLACKGKTVDQNKFEDLTETERDSMATLYNRYSKEFYQPSEIHRRFKDTALIIKPDHVEYRQLLSYSYEKRGEHIKAMEILNEAVETDVANNKTSALQYRAWSLLYYYRDYKGTIEDVDLINKMESNNNYTTCHGEPCNLLKGQALYKLEQYDEAISVLQDLLALEEEMGWDPLDNFHAYFYIARSFSELKNYAEAIEIYNSLVEVNPKFTEAYFQLGKIYNTLGDKENAENYLTIASELLSEGHKMGEPYFERFDEVFEYEIEDELEKIGE